MSIKSIIFKKYRRAWRRKKPKTCSISKNSSDLNCYAYQLQKKKKQFQKILTFGDDMHDRVFFHEIHIFPIEKRTNPIRVVLKSY